MPIAYLHATTINANRDPAKQRALTMKDMLIFGRDEDGEGHIDEQLLGDW